MGSFLRQGQGAAHEVRQQRFLTPFLPREAWQQKAFLGENYRQSELHGAVAYEQLKKRDRILARTRALKAKLRDAVAAIPGAEPEIVHDRDGDCGISLAFFMRDSATAQALAEVMKCEGVNCGTRFSKDIPDRHIYFHWGYIMEKRTPHLNGFPWNAGDPDLPVNYHRDMCPQTIDLLGRAVALPVTQLMSDAYVDQVCAAIGKVARALRNPAG